MEFDDEDDFEEQADLAFFDQFIGRTTSRTSSNTHQLSFIERAAQSNLQLQEHVRVLLRQVQQDLDKCNAAQVRLEDAISLDSDKQKDWKRTLKNEQQDCSPEFDLHGKKAAYLYKKSRFGRLEKAVLEKEVKRQNMRILSEGGKIDINTLDPQELLTNVTNINWESVARQIPHRTSIDCVVQWTINQHPSINKEPFTKEELKTLKELVESRYPVDWVKVAEDLGTNRVACDCFRMYQRFCNPNRYREWTTDEDSKLRALVEQFGNDWNKVSMKMDGRSPKQCLHRWRQTQLLAAIQKHGRGNWAAISRDMSTRTDVQCRERYENVLNPDLKKDAFSDEELVKLEGLVMEHGEGAWSAISQQMTARTQKMCKRAWLNIKLLRSKQREDTS
ncbi:Myb-like DNA-binding domain protein [Phlyctochytrium planicorne]|nr:Myb-like DNA-binding domain protein [Phlyctochytrium planicorne]